MFWKKITSILLLVVLALGLAAPATAYEEEASAAVTVPAEIEEIPGPLPEEPEKETAPEFPDDAAPEENISSEENAPETEAPISEEAPEDVPAVTLSPDGPVEDDAKAPEPTAEDESETVPDGPASEEPEVPPLEEVCQVAADEAAGTAEPLLLDALPATVTLTARSGVPTDVDRIYFFNSQNSICSSDLILVESQGHFGLIDASNRQSDVLYDSKGKPILLTEEAALVNTRSFKNGKSIAEYMITALGVTHLDFIIGTHAHSDHIGGVPEIAALVFTTDGADVRRLVDSDTVYFYKKYHFINEKEENEWHDGEFVQAAVRGVTAQGGKAVDVSLGLSVTSAAQAKNDYSAVLQAIDSTAGLSGAAYDEGSRKDWYDDFLSFRMGALTLRLYNLFATPTDLNENVNSIATAITKDRVSVVSLGDLNDDQQVEQKVTQAIASDIGTVDLLKAAHHGAALYSNTRETIDALQPAYVVATSPDKANVPGNYMAARYYAQTVYGTTFYVTGKTTRALVATLDDRGVSFSDLAGASSPVYQSARAALDKRSVTNGWISWDYSAAEDGSDVRYMFFQKGAPLTGWQKQGSRWYWFDAAGVSGSGLTAVGKAYYWLTPNSGVGYRTGWVKSGKTYYYFGSGGAAATGWLRSGGSWYYLSSKGQMRTGWITVGRKQYYMASSGAMCTGWQKLGGRWYYLASSGAMKTGWLRSGSWYYLKSTGVMAAGETLRIGGTRYTFSTSGAWIG